MMLKRLVIPLMLLILLVSEGIAIDLLPDMITTTKTLIVPHWILMFLLVVAIFYDTERTSYAIIYGIVFGLLIDVVYTNVLGVYMFVYPFSLYIAQILNRLLQSNFLMTIIHGIVAITITEFLILFIYSFIDIVDSTSFYFLTYRLLPTIIANLMFLILIYVLFNKRFERWRSALLEK